MRSNLCNGIGKIIAIVLVIAILAGTIAVFAPRLLHHCDNCDQFFVGTGYYANIVTNTLTQWQGAEEKVICADCAAKEHALAILAGKSIQDFKRPLFEDKED